MSDCKELVGTVGRKIRKNPYHDMAMAILETGIRENDRFDTDQEWLYVLCGLSDMHPDQYQRALDYFYGPRIKDEEDENG